MCFDTLVDPRTVGMPFAPPWQCDLPMFPLIICRPAAVRSRHKQTPKEGLGAAPAVGGGSALAAASAAAAAAAARGAGVGAAGLASEGTDRKIGCHVNEKFRKLQNDRTTCVPYGTAAPSLRTKGLG